MNRISFKNYIMLREGQENFDQPHTISSDPPMKLPPELQRLAEVFKKANEVSLGKEVDPKGGEKDITLRSKKLYVVGDAVAAHLMNRTPRSFDLVTDAHPDEIVKICGKANPPVHVVKKDDNRGVVTVQVDGKKYEIETLKDGESGAEDGTMPYTTDLRKDTTRRELTVDGLYYDILGKKIIDYTGGLRHIQSGDVKFIGRAEDKVGKDGLKKFHYAYMVNKLPNGKIDPQVKDLLSAKDGEELPPEKVRDKFWAGFEDLHVKPQRYIKTFDDLGLLKTVFPGLKLTPKLPDVPTVKTRPVALAFLLRDNDPEKLVEVLRKLKYTDREVKDAVFLINLLRYEEQYADEFKRQLLKTGLSKRQIRDWVKANHLDEEDVDELLNSDFPQDQPEMTADPIKSMVGMIQSAVGF